MSSEPSHVALTRVFIRGLEVMAEIGVHDHELGRRQPLLVDIELTVEAEGWRKLADTVDYEHLAEHARRIADQGHIGLVESYAERLAEACFAEPRVAEVRVRVEKPRALAPQAAAAGVEIIARRR